MTDRDAHRAAVEAGYASLAEYIKKWGDDKMELLQRLRDPFKVTPKDAAEAADYIERLREENKDIRIAVNLFLDEWDDGGPSCESIRAALKESE